MQKPNYQFEKRQREQAKKRKKAEKAAKKEGPDDQPDPQAQLPEQPAPTVDPK